ncbi:hypothetical protein JAAARDRAFT_38392 [Jaapia argillacea MUCL 33604]|uniref:Uncharacterized protein n=1 Tax=Jaapia argillacea MUCL 33604 TaxID=933084 RepID=A0A067PSE8_9AGAM|nr:hypothetical protein JAAARDRAFT_38392 [Jaapia argillacea MUCL 33604]
MGMFNATIKPNPLLTGSHFVGIPGDTNLSDPYDVSSSTANNLSGAQILRMYPSSSSSGSGSIPIDRVYQLPAIIEVSYLCHDLRIKSPPAFISSVFVGTISTFMAFRAFVLLIATVLAKRYSERANYCEGSLALEEGISQAESRHAQGAVPSIEVTENGVMLEMETLHDRTGSDVTLSTQPASPRTMGRRFMIPITILNRHRNLVRCLGKTPKRLKAST